LKAGANINMNAGANAKGGHFHETTPLLCLKHYFKKNYSAAFDDKQFQMAHLLLEANCDINNPACLSDTISPTLYYDLDELIPLLLGYGAFIPENVMWRCKPNARFKKMFFY